MNQLDTSHTVKFSIGSRAVMSLTTMHPFPQEHYRGPYLFTFSFFSVQKFACSKFACTQFLSSAVAPQLNTVLFLGGVNFFLVKCLPTASQSDPLHSSHQSNLNSSTKKFPSKGTLLPLIINLLSTTQPQLSFHAEVQINHYYLTFQSHSSTS